MNKAMDSHEGSPHGVLPPGNFPCGIMPPVDLHVHSNRSDGTFSPSQLVDYAIEKGLAAFALTDHDTIDGLEEAITYAESLKSGQHDLPSAAPAGPCYAASNAYTNTEPGSAASDAYANAEPDGATSDAYANTEPDGATSDVNAYANTEPDGAISAAYANAEPDGVTSDAYANTEPSDITSDANACANTEPDGAISDAYTNAEPDKQASAAISQKRIHFNTQPQSNTRLPQIPEVIPGIEFSTEYQGQDVHIVGLYIDYHNATFQKQLQVFVDSRDTRNRKMCRLLQEHGIHITYDDLLTEFPDAVITRAHYAKYMLSHGYIKSMKEAFERYIDDHGPCYVPREKITPDQAVKLILTANGIPILAHPVLYHMSDERLDTLTAKLKNAGLVGIEAIYSTYNSAEERQIRALASKYGLLISGGSDFHGTNKPGLDLAVGYGKLFIPYSVLQDLKNTRNSLSTM